VNQPAVAVFAVGNRSRGDDAIGPLLLGRLELWLAAEGRDADFELIEDCQLQIEHALDLRGKRMALFIDADCSMQSPVGFSAVEAAAGIPAPSTHALRPQAVLEVYRQVLGEEPPPSFLLRVRGERFALGEGLSGAAEANVESAWQQLMQLCLLPQAAHWRTSGG
jgi:hydrogenase maturation protease